MIDQETGRIIESISKVNHQVYEYWITKTLLTWQWWLGVILTTVPWGLWIIFRRRHSTYRLLFVGLFATFFSATLDSLGIFLRLWFYKYKVLPTIPSYIPWDCSLIPVMIMFMLQYKPKFSPWIKAVGFGIFASFIAEPIFVWIDLYLPIHWKYIYSFPIYVMLYLICHFLSKRSKFEPL